MKPISELLLVFLGCCVLTSTVLAKDIKLGQVSLLDNKDTDVIRLAACGDNSKNRLVKAIQLRVRRRAAEIDRVVVHFNNDAQEELVVRNYIKAGKETRWLDLRAGSRCIRKIVIRGDAETRATRNDRAFQSRIVVWGRT